MAQQGSGLKMDTASIIQLLENEWDMIEMKGFFGCLTLGKFDDEGFERVRNILSSVQVPEGDTFDKRFVEVIWFIPTFMRWQQDGWRDEGKATEKLAEAIAFVEQRLTTILGLP